MSIGPLLWTSMIVVAIPVLAIALCLVLSVVAALAARRPDTRRHCLSVMGRLTYLLAILLHKKGGSATSPFNHRKGNISGFGDHPQPSASARQSAPSQPGRPRWSPPRGPDA